MVAISPESSQIVREHQFCNRYRVVFVHDGNHFIFEHCLHAMFLVEVMRTAAKVLFRGEHRSHNTCHVPGTVRNTG